MIYFASFYLPEPNESWETPKYDDLDLLVGFIREQLKVKGVTLDEVIEVEYAKGLVIKNDSDITDKVRRML